MLCEILIDKLVLHNKFLSLNCKCKMGFCAVNHISTFAVLMFDFVDLVIFTFPYTYVYTE